MLKKLMPYAVMLAVVLVFCGCAGGKGQVAVSAPTPDPANDTAVIVENNLNEYINNNSFTSKQWPAGEAGKQITQPKGTLEGALEYEGGAVVYLSGVEQADFDAYLGTVRAGFSIGVTDSVNAETHVYAASRDDGYYINIKYSFEDKTLIMSIELAAG